MDNVRHEALQHLPRGELIDRRTGDGKERDLETDLGVINESFACLA
jgi:hypothetical protein